MYKLKFNFNATPPLHLEHIEDIEEYFYWELEEGSWREIYRKVSINDNTISGYIIYELDYAENIDMLLIERDDLELT